MKTNKEIYGNNHSLILLIFGLIILIPLLIYGIIKTIIKDTMLWFKIFIWQEES